MDKIIVFVPVSTFDWTSINFSLGGFVYFKFSFSEGVMIKKSEQLGKSI